MVLIFHHFSFFFLKSYNEVGDLSDYRLGILASNRVRRSQGRPLLRRNTFESAQPLIAYNVLSDFLLCFTAYISASDLLEVLMTRFIS
jgi:hypothetical protein